MRQSYEYSLQEIPHSHSAISVSKPAIHPGYYDHQLELVTRQSYQYSMQETPHSHSAISVSKPAVNPDY